jgi:hypothetical protein
MSVAVLALLAGMPAAAIAQTPEPTATASELKRQGDAAMDALRYDDGLALYKKAYALSRDPALLYNQARSYQALGDYASALDYLERFETEASTALRARVPDLGGLDAELRGKVATLTIRCNVAGAEVVLRDKVLGQTPLAGPLKTTAGRATLIIHAESYQPFRRELDLAGGSALTVEVFLTQRDRTGILTVHSTVAGARVTVDGTPRGDAPIELVTPAGMHQVRVESAGYEAAQTSVVVDVGHRKDLDVPLAKTSPITAKWWFWTGIGAVVAGGVVTVVVLTTERSPDRGTISPGVVSGAFTKEGAGGVRF